MEPKVNIVILNVNMSFTLLKKKKKKTINLFTIGNFSYDCTQLFSVRSAS